MPRRLACTRCCYMLTWHCLALNRRSQLLGKLLADLASMREESIQTAGLQHAGNSSQVGRGAGGAGQHEAGCRLRDQTHQPSVANQPTQLLPPNSFPPLPQYDVMADFANMSVGGSVPAGAAAGGGQDEGGAAAAAASQQDEVVGTGACVAKQPVRYCECPMKNFNRRLGPCALPFHLPRASHLCMFLNLAPAEEDLDHPQFCALSPTAHSEPQKMKRRIRTPACSASCRVPTTPLRSSTPTTPNPRPCSLALPASPHTPPLAQPSAQCRPYACHAITRVCLCCSMQSRRTQRTTPCCTGCAPPMLRCAGWGCRRALAAGGHGTAATAPSPSLTTLGPAGHQLALPPRAHPHLLHLRVPHALPAQRAALLPHGWVAGQGRGALVRGCGRREGGGQPHATCTC